MSRNRIAAAVCVAALAGGGAGAAAVALRHDNPSQARVAAAPAPQASNVAAATLTVGQIAKQASSGVVEIAAATTSSSSPFPGNSGSSAAEGTGFVYDAKGDIVTNAHVVSGASSITVKFSDGTSEKATVVGIDESSDLAVIKVNASASKLTVLQLGDSSKLQVGDGVVAIGNPFGLDNTVTTGIVSALDREISAPDQTPIEGAIQTDAAINPGNSGGPLFDLAGKVVGVNSQIQSDSGGNDGVGFAISSNMARPVVTQLIATGKVEHALLGVNVQTAAGNAGVRVGQVQQGSGAADAGLRPGDLITAAGGETVKTAERLRAIIAARRPGDTLSVQVRRGGGTKTLDVRLGTRS